MKVTELIAFIFLGFEILLTLWWGINHVEPPILGVIFTVPPLFSAFILYWAFSRRPSTQIRMASLSAICLPAALFIPINPLDQALFTLVAWLSRILGVEAPVIPVAVIIVFQVLLILGVVSVNYIWYLIDCSPNQAHQRQAETSDTLGPKYVQELYKYCESLKKFLKECDDEVSWDERTFTPLEAEVAISNEDKSSAGIFQLLRAKIQDDRPSRRTKNLVSAIQRDSSSNIFVVLGDPGSGKSVSLRKLVRHLCEESSKTNVLPIYLNLREWDVTKDGELEAGNKKVTEEKIQRFIENQVGQHMGEDAQNFIKRYYDACRQSGQIFLVIDSFDEHPAILDCDDRTDKHKNISKGFDDFFDAALKQGGSKAVLASRTYREPSAVRGTRLTIQPLREPKIRQLFARKKIGTSSDKYIIRLFQERSHLVPHLRNPFTAALIAEYAKNQNSLRRSHQHHTEFQLPDSMFEVFDSYFNDNIKQRLEDLLQQPGTDISIDQLREAARIIAMQMYEQPNIGLEAPMAQVRSWLNQDEQVKDDLIDALKRTRLARRGTHDQWQFSFVHRRFAEFFVVDHIRCHPHRYLNKGFIDEKLESGAIQTDSRWRDCLVLFCSSADEAEAAVCQRIAMFCWDEIQQCSELILSDQPCDEEFRRCLYYLRFINEAFRSAPTKSNTSAIQGFRSDLGELVIQLMNQTEHRGNLIKKRAVELIPLLSEEYQTKALEFALGSRSNLIFETAFESCQYLGTLEPSVEIYIRRYVRSIPFLEKIKDFGKYDFILSLSDALKKQRIAFWADSFMSGLLIFIAFVSTYIFTQSTSFNPLKFSIGLLVLFILSAAFISPTTLFIKRSLEERKEEIVNLENLYSPDISIYNLDLNYEKEKRDIQRALDVYSASEELSDISHLNLFSPEPAFGKARTQKILFVFLRIYTPIAAVLACISNDSIPPILAWLSLLSFMWWEIPYESSKVLFRSSLKHLKRSPDIIRDLIILSFVIPSLILKEILTIPGSILSSLFRIEDVLEKLPYSVSDFVGKYKTDKEYRLRVNDEWSKIGIGFFLVALLSFLMKWVSSAPTPPPKANVNQEIDVGEFLQHLWSFGGTKIVVGFVAVPGILWLCYQPFDRYQRMSTARKDIDDDIKALKRKGETLNWKDVYDNCIALKNPGRWKHHKKLNIPALQVHYLDSLRHARIFPEGDISIEPPKDLLKNKSVDDAISKLKEEGL